MIESFRGKTHLAAGVTSRCGDVLVDATWFERVSLADSCLKGLSCGVPVANDFSALASCSCSSKDYKNAKIQGHRSMLY